MSWSNLKELLLQERKLLETGASADYPQDSPFESQHSALLGAYLSTKAQVDRAVACFAHTLEWPEMTPLEKLFVVARLDFAWEVVSILNSPHQGRAMAGYPSADDASLSPMLEWLLVDIWPYGCGRFLNAQKLAIEQPSALPSLPLRLAPDLLKAECVA
jgi:hypothetical protein